MLGSSGLVYFTILLGLPLSPLYALAQSADFSGCSTFTPVCRPEQTYVGMEVNPYNSQAPFLVW